MVSQGKKNIRGITSFMRHLIQSLLSDALEFCDADAFQKIMRLLAEKTSDPEDRIKDCDNVESMCLLLRLTIHQSMPLAALDILKHSPSHRFCCDCVFKPYTYCGPNDVDYRSNIREVFSDIISIFVDDGSIHRLSHVAIAAGETCRRL